MRFRPAHFAVVITSALLQTFFFTLNLQAAHFIRPQRQTNQTDRVTASLEAVGETQYLDAQEKQQHEKLEVTCLLEYYEKMLIIPTTSDGTYQSLRQYHKVAAAVKIGNHRLEPTLLPEHKLIFAEAGNQVMLTSLMGNLSRAELDVIDVQASSILLDRLLPGEAVEVGESWPHPSELMAAMLGLDEVSKTTVHSTFKEVTDVLFRFEISGQVEGRSYGAKTTIDLKGKYRFDRRIGRIDWIGLLIKEHRRPGPVTDGIHVACRLQMTVVPCRTPETLSDAALKKYNLATGVESAWLRQEFAGSGWSCLHDRRWFAEGNGNVLRLLDGEKLIGQCDFAALPRSDVRRLVSLEEFQKDIRTALKESFGEFVEAAQSVDSQNRRILRVVVRGAARMKSLEVPIRWICYHLADQEGNQAAMTFTIEEEYLSRFADADRPIVASLRFEGQGRGGGGAPNVRQREPSPGSREAQKPSAPKK